MQVTSINSNHVYLFKNKKKNMEKQNIKLFAKSANITNIINKFYNRLINMK